MDARSPTTDLVATLKASLGRKDRAGRERQGRSGAELDGPVRERADPDLGPGRSCRIETGIASASADQAQAPAIRRGINGR